MVHLPAPAYYLLNITVSMDLLRLDAEPWSHHLVPPAVNTLIPSCALFSNCLPPSGLTGCSDACQLRVGLLVGLYWTIHVDLLSTLLPRTLSEHGSVYFRFCVGFFGHIPDYPCCIVLNLQAGRWTCWSSFFLPNEPSILCSSRIQFYTIAPPPLPIPMVH